MLQLNKLARNSKDRKQIGRGGDRGGTSGRGHKGQKSRTGSISEIRPTFEGGQMPLSRRLPKRGFNNIFKKEVKVVNLIDLETNFNSGDIVNRQSLIDKNLLKGQSKFLIKILGSGKLTKKLTVQANLFSQTASKAISDAGGKVELEKVEIKKEQAGGSSIA